MAIGVADRHLEVKMKPANDKNVVYYHSRGIFWNGQKIIEQNENKFNEGQFVNVKVDLRDGIIGWKVDGKSKKTLHV